MSKQTIIGGGLLVFALLCALCIAFHAGPIMQRLHARSAVTDVKPKEDSPHQATRRLQLDQEFAGATIEFPMNSAVITQQAGAILDRLVPIFRNFPNLSVEIGGHTDSQGSAEYNRQLSQCRSEAVRQYLSAQGVSLDRLTVVGYGSTRPIVEESTPEGRQKNRRVEFHVQQGE